MRLKLPGRAFKWFCLANLALWLTLVAAHAQTYAIPIIYDSGVYWADVGIGQHTIRCIVDTGAAFAQVNAQELGADWRPTIVKEIVDANGDIVRMWSGRTTLRLGQLSIPAVLISAHTGQDTDCLIGQSVFERFHTVLLDREHSYLFLGD